MQTRWGEGKRCGADGGREGEGEMQTLEAGNERDGAGAMRRGEPRRANQRGDGDMCWSLEACLAFGSFHLLTAWVARGRTPYVVFCCFYAVMEFLQALQWLELGTAVGRQETPAPAGATRPSTSRSPSPRTCSYMRSP